MKIQWNWGTKLVIGIILYLSFILTMVFLMVREDVPLVEDDYYPQAVEYQNKIDKKTNAAHLEKGILITQTSQEITMQFQSFFDAKDVSGKIWVYRPSKPEDDFSVPVSLDSLNRQQFPASAFERGKYIFKVDYLVADIPYYQEVTLNVN